MNPLIEIITSDKDEVRNQSLDSACARASLQELLDHARELEAFRQQSNNLYHRVRALSFLAAIYRYHLPPKLPTQQSGSIPYHGYCQLLERRFGEAIQAFLEEQSQHGPSDALASALASAYHQLTFQTLADQVRRSVRTVRGNQWMFRLGHPDEHPLRIRRELLQRTPSGAYPVLAEKTAVRMDFSHSAWSDIFFLGMDYPEGARVLNVSVDLGVRGRDNGPRPPIETYLRVIDEPVLRLASVDLNAKADVGTIQEVFDFAKDYLGLLKAAVIAAGIVPPGMEGSPHDIRDLLEQIVGPGLGLELVSVVNGIPKGSRLAVSTNLLGSLISICMRATGQVSALNGALTEGDRRIVAARAILGEWLGGSGGGWQDSGGVWPGIKLICGTTAEEGDPEFGISRGRLLPKHEVLTDESISEATREKIQDSLVLVHGGMAQNVGPILEMVTEKYLLRSDDEWKARHEATKILDQVVDALRVGDIAKVGSVTTHNFFGPLQAIVPWATNRYTELLIERTRNHFKDDFWGFWMLGGMSGGGMGFIFDPKRKAEAQDWLGETMIATKQELESALPFAMTPVVYDFSINNRGTWAELHSSDELAMPQGYYAQMVPDWLRESTRSLSPLIRLELERLGSSLRASDEPELKAGKLLEGLLPASSQNGQHETQLSDLLNQHGFDSQQHEQIRSDLRAGRIGLAQNRLPANITIRDVEPEDVIDLRGELAQQATEIGKQAISNGEVGVVSLAAGVGSRWTAGAGVVKSLHPFCRLNGRHRNFVEVHLAKTRRVAGEYNVRIPHIFTTGYMTDEPIREHLQASDFYGMQDSVYVSPGRSVGLRTIPMVRDLRFAWEELPQQVLDEQQEKVRASLRTALVNWATQAGEGEDYTDNKPMQCMHPVGHWYEIPNMFRNGVLRQLLDDQPQLKYLMLHNIDTLGACVDPTMLGTCIDNNWCLGFEVIARRLDDRGGGLARVNGQVRLVEGLAMPHEEDEFALSYYNSMTTWIDIDQTLAAFGLNRDSLADAAAVDEAVREMGRRLPTYITLKDVKKRWGQGQEDVFPVAQFEKLWGDMSAIPSIESGFMVVPLGRGQQMKDAAQLDGWLRDGSAQYVADLCQWSD